MYLGKCCLQIFHSSNVRCPPGMVVVGRWCLVISLSGRPTDSVNSRVRAYCICSKCGRGCLDIFAELAYGERDMVVTILFSVCACVSKFAHACVRPDLSGPKLLHLYMDFKINSCCP